MSDQNDARKAWRGLLDKVPAAALARFWALFGPIQDHRVLRCRAGAIGARFDLGEMTVTRCSIKLADGTVRHAYAQGRDKDRAKVAALIDGLDVRSWITFHAELEVVRKLYRKAQCLPETVE